MLEAARVRVAAAVRQLGLGCAAAVRQLGLGCAAAVPHQT
jgi:hypothetical protein